MNREKALLKNTAIITIGKVCTQLVSFFLLPLYTAILTVEEYGTVDLLNTLILLLLPIVTFQIEQAVFRSLIDNRENEEEKKRIISTGFYCVVIQSIIYLILFFMIAPWVQNDYKFFLATNVIACIFSSLSQQISRGIGKNNHYAISSFLTAFTIIIFNIIFLVIFKLGANGMLIANMIGQFACFTYLVIALNLFQYISYHKFKRQLLKSFLKYSLPLVPNAISWWIFHASDRIIVSSILGVAQNGILSAAHKFSSVLITIFNIFYLTWTETVSLHINDFDAKEFINRMINTVLKIFVSMAIIMIAGMPLIYPMMINANYSEGYYQVPIMMIASIFNVLIGLMSAIYVAKKNTKTISNTSIISAIINIVVHLALIKFVGLYAATISTLCAYFLMSLKHMHYLKKRYFEIKIEKKFIFFTIMTLIPILIAYYSNNKIIYAIGMIIAIVYTFLLNKKNLHSILNIVFKKTRSLK